MSRSPRFCGVILSAGASTRMGTDKALLAWPPLTPGKPPLTASQTFLSAAIRSLAPYTDMVIVVAGANEPQIAPVAYAEGASLVRNPEPDRGQFSSLQVGLRDVLNHGRDAALVTLVDRPPVRGTTIETIRDAFAESPVDVWAIVPEYESRHGHPFALARELIEAFLRAPATTSAREIEHAHQPHIHYLPVDDPFVCLNVDTPEDYARLNSQYVSH
jgi:molybdenum cofactor cytidylyltransferase